MITLYTHIPTLDDIKNNINPFFITEENGLYYGNTIKYSDETTLNSDIIHHTIQLESINTNVIIIGLNNNQPISGKIDTGAECCCLNAQNIKVNQDQVEFDFKTSRFKMKLNSMQQIVTADHTETRPVIKVTCKVNDKVLEDVLINLNDRGELDDLLVGMNLIKLIDIKPNIHEYIDQCKKALF